jgi:acetolactate decarboxylase
MASLDAFLSERLRQRGVALDVPVPLRITGPVSELGWHVVDGSKLSAGAGHEDHARTATSGVLGADEVELVGFFSTAHQGVFTHRGASSHFHVIAREPLLTGHVDAVTLRAGARLWLPRR